MSGGWRAAGGTWERLEENRRPPPASLSYPTSVQQHVFGRQSTFLAGSVVVETSRHGQQSVHVDEGHPWRKKDGRASLIKWCAGTDLRPVKLSCSGEVFLKPATTTTSSPPVDVVRPLNTADPSTEVSVVALPGRPVPPQRRTTDVEERGSGGDETNVVVEGDINAVKRKEGLRETSCERQRGVALRAA